MSFRYPDNMDLNGFIVAVRAEDDQTMLDFWNLNKRQMIGIAHKFSREDDFVANNALLRLVRRVKKGIEIQNDDHLVNLFNLCCRYENVELIRANNGRGIKDRVERVRLDYVPEPEDRRPDDKDTNVSIAEVDRELLWTLLRKAINCLCRRAQKEN